MPNSRDHVPINTEVIMPDGVLKDISGYFNNGSVKVQICDANGNPIVAGGTEVAAQVQIVDGLGNALFVTLNPGKVDVLSSVLPTGAATETTVSAINTVIGATSDAQNADETTSGSLMSFIKGTLGKVKAILAILPTALTAGGNFKVSVQESIGLSITAVPEIEVKNDSGNPIAISAIDGSILSLGATTDAAVTNPASAGTIIGILKGILTKLGGVVISAADNIIGRIKITDGTNVVAVNADGSINALRVLPTIPTLYNVPMTLANTEYYQTLPSSVKKYELSIMDGSSSDNYRIAFATGKVAGLVAPYIKRNADVEYYQQDINFTGTIYFACSASGKTMQIETWT